MFDDLQHLYGKVKDIMPARYRVHVVEGATQFIAFDGRMFTTQGLIDALKRHVAARPASVPTSLSGFALIAVSQAKLNTAAYWISRGAPHADVCRLLAC